MSNHLSWVTNHQYVLILSMFSVTIKTIRASHKMQHYNKNSSVRLISFTLTWSKQIPRSIPLKKLVFFILHSSSGHVGLTELMQTSVDKLVLPRSLRLWRHASFNPAESSAVPFCLQGSIHSFVCCQKTKGAVAFEHMYKCSEVRESVFVFRETWSGFVTFFGSANIEEKAFLRGIWREVKWRKVNRIVRQITLKQLEGEVWQCADAKPWIHS